MKKYKTNTADTCWRDCVGCLLEIEPSKVPNFVKRYGNTYVERTHKWLKNRFKKGIVYVPSKYFMESCKIKFNKPYGPSGYSMGYMTMVDKSASHVVICYDGKVIWDNGDERHDEYDVLVGFFIIYNLECMVLKNTKNKIINIIEDYNI